MSKDLWIPCIGENARLPSKDECIRFDENTNEYYYSFLVTKKEHYSRYTTQACFSIGEDKSYWYRDENDLTEVNNIIAWQSLPQPYTGQSLL